MKSEAIASGDQPFGAVLVKGGVIVGYGPSRVVSDRNPDAHAERVALWDAQKRLGINDMTGAVMYSTSRPCVACEHALARANVERMYFGADGVDAGMPRRSS
jgi:tRNA(Arg) A34 adenosine deaminase TadA